MDKYSFNLVRIRKNFSFLNTHANLSPLYPFVQIECSSFIHSAIEQKHQLHKFMLCILVLAERLFHHLFFLINAVKQCNKVKDK